MKKKRHGEEYVLFYYNRIQIKILVMNNIEISHLLYVIYDLIKTRLRYY